MNDLLDSRIIKDKCKYDVDIVVLLNFMVMLDYLYCSMTEEQLLELVSDYYENADDIYNSIVRNTKNNKYQS